MLDASDTTRNAEVQGKYASSPIDYFIVGSYVVLSSLHSYDEPTGFPFRLAVFDSSIHLSRSDLVFAADLGNDNILQVSMNIAQFERNLPFEQVVEGLEIFLKACIRRGARSILCKLDLSGASAHLRTTVQTWGFRRGEDPQFTRVLTSDLLKPCSQFSDMEHVYQHPLDIPWNFVPLDYDAYLPLLQQDHRGRVLDVGVGFGRNAIPLEQRGFEVYGIDIAPTAIQRCRQFVQRPQNYVVGSLTDLPFDISFFDIVLDVGCLHCMGAEERSKAVTEIHRVLKPTGLVYSRIFKPRPQEWLNVQPFYTSSFGLTSDEALALFTGHLRTHIWREHVDINYIIAQKEDLR